MAKEYNRIPRGPAIHEMYNRAARNVVAKSGYGTTNSAHPGQNMGLTLDQVKQLVENSVKAVGVHFVSTAGVVPITPQLPAQAKYIVGISISQTNQSDDQFNLSVNNEEVITGASVLNFMKSVGAGGISEVPYYELFRPIGGSTALTLEYLSTVGGDKLVFTVFYV